MISGLVLALVASVFTASASVTQRLAAAPAPGELAFSLRLILYLIRKPMWFIGILCMVLGFVFQVAALRGGSLSLVQPVIATELLFVFVFLALRGPLKVQRRDWIAAVAMALGLACFLWIADPKSGSDHAPHLSWFLAGLGTMGATVLFWMLARMPLRSGRRPSPSRQAALLAVAAGIAWGFVAAVIKELSGHLAGGPYAVFTNWSPYVLLVAGAGAFFLLSNAFQAGSLAASQPGLTIVDPLVASALGVLLFKERIRHDPLELVGEVLALLVLVGGVILLSRSQLVLGGSAGRTEQPTGACLVGVGSSATGLGAIETCGVGAGEAKPPNAPRRRPETTLVSASCSRASPQFRGRLAAPDFSAISDPSIRGTRNRRPRPRFGTHPRCPL